MCWKQRIELSSFIALFEINPEVLSRHNGNASALTTVKTWLYLCMQIQTNIVLRSCRDYWRKKKAGYFIMGLIKLLQSLHRSGCIRSCSAIAGAVGPIHTKIKTSKSRRQHIICNTDLLVEWKSDNVSCTRFARVVKMSYDNIKT